MCLLRFDWVIAQLVWQNRLENRTSCNSFSSDFHVSGTFERHVTRYDWPMYRAIGRLRAGEPYRVAAPLELTTCCQIELGTRNTDVVKCLRVGKLTNSLT